MSLQLEIERNRLTKIVQFRTQHNVIIFDKAIVKICDKDVPVLENIPFTQEPILMISSDEMKSLDLDPNVETVENLTVQAMSRLAARFYMNSSGGLFIQVSFFDCVHTFVHR